MRSVYLCYLRSSPPPELAAFDLPDFTSVLGLRDVSTVPGQALHLYNSPFVIEQAASLANLVMAQTAAPEERVKVAWQRAFRREPSKTELKQAGQDAIRQVTQILATIEGRKFQVTGHTDNVPIKSAKFKSNWELSAARAVEVVKFMSSSGMDGKRLSAAGYADQLSVAGNDTDDGRRKNRRIEIVVQPNIEELPGMEDVGVPKS